jgi:ABC-2 type transport system ATP-binding protein
MHTMSGLVIETHGLTKRYGNVVAVEDLDLSIRRGEVFGLLGPNGSGKTTTILMLLGLTEPTSGSVQVLGMNPARKPLSVKAKVGYMPDEVGFYDELSARSNLSYIARLNALSYEVGRKRIEAALSRVGLSSVIDHPVATFSRGMRRRLGVADLFLKEPELIIMDEPTQGLDPEGAHDFLGLIRDLKAQDITVLLSSHLLQQVQAVCDRVGLFRKGHMELEGTVIELARKLFGSVYRIRVQAKGASGTLLETLRRVPGVVGVGQSTADHFEIDAAKDVRPDIAAAVVAYGASLLELSIQMASLDEIYVRHFEEAEHGSKR